MTDIDVANSIIHLAWDAIRQGIWVFVRPNSGVAETQYFYDLRTEGWFPMRFASTTFNPSSVLVFDQDAPQDQQIVLGCADGIVRRFVRGKLTDDTAVFERYFLLGPWQAKEMAASSVQVRTIDAMVGRDGGCNLELLTAVDPQSAIENGRSMFRMQVEPEKSNVWRPGIAARSVALRVSALPLSDIQLEGIRMELQDGRFC